MEPALGKKFPEPEPPQNRTAPKPCLWHFVNRPHMVVSGDDRRQTGPVVAAGQSDLVRLLLFYGFFLNLAIKFVLKKCP